MPPPLPFFPFLGSAPFPVSPIRPSAERFSVARQRGGACSSGMFFSLLTRRAPAGTGDVSIRRPVCTFRLAGPALFLCTHRFPSLAVSPPCALAFLPPPQSSPRADGAGQAGACPRHAFAAKPVSRLGRAGQAVPASGTRLAPLRSLPPFPPLEFFFVLTKSGPPQRSAALLRGSTFDWCSSLRCPPALPPPRKKIASWYF